MGLSRVLPGRGRPTGRIFSPAVALRQPSCLLPTPECLVRAGPCAVDSGPSPCPPVGSRLLSVEAGEAAGTRGGERGAGAAWPDAALGRSEHGSGAGKEAEAQRGRLSAPGTHSAELGPALPLSPKRVS